MKVLWVIPRWPLPENDGARVATAQCLRAIGRDDRFRLSVLATVPREDRPDADALARQTGAREVRVAARRTRLLGSSRPLQALHTLRQPGAALTFAAFSAAGPRRALLDWLRAEKFDRLVFDGLHAAAILAPGGRFNAAALAGLPWLYRAHNVEADLWWTSARRASGPRRRFLEDQARRVDALEREVVAQASLTLPVSSEDEERFGLRNRADRSRVVWISQPFGATAPEPRGVGSPVYGFLGKMDWNPNREGLEWLLHAVWPEVIRRNPDARLRIGGSGTVPAFARGLPGVEILGYIEDLADFYRPLDALLVPIFSGSGTRVKVIEAARFARACVSTTLGAAGTDFVSGEASRIAETAEEWIEILSQPAPWAELGQGAWRSGRQRFDENLNAARLVKALQDARP